MVLSGQKRMLKETDSTELAAIRKSDVPKWVRDGMRYRSWSDDTQTIVSRNVLKTDLVLRSATDLDHFLSTVRFWGVKEKILSTVTLFVIQRWAVKNLDQVLADHEGDFSFLRPLRLWVEHPDTTVIDYVVQYGELPLLAFLHQSRGYLPNYLVDIAVKHDHLHCLKYLISKSCVCTVETFQSFYQHPDFWNADLCRAAAEGGNLLCLAYAHLHHCAWDTRTCAAAARQGQLECLKFAHEHGCPWDESVLLAAVEGDHKNCLKYLLLKGCYWDNATVKEVKRCKNSSKAFMLEFVKCL